MLKKVYSILLQNSPKQNLCDILFSVVNYPQHEADVKKVLPKLDENYKEFKLENL